MSDLDKYEAKAVSKLLAACSDHPKFTEFLVELDALYSKFDMSIGSCGCCNSPWLEFDDDLIDGATKEVIKATAEQLKA